MRNGTNMTSPITRVYSAFIVRLLCSYMVATVCHYLEGECFALSHLPQLSPQGPETPAISSRQHHNNALPHHFVPSLPATPLISSHFSLSCPFSNNMLALLYAYFRKVEFLIEFSIIVALMLYSIYAPTQRTEEQRRKSLADRANLLNTTTTPI